MSAVGDLNRTVHGDLRLSVVVFQCDIGKGCQHVYLRHCSRRLLHALQHGSQTVPHLGEDALLQPEHPVFCAEDFILHLFQFLGDKPFAVGESLLADVVRRNQVVVRACDFQIVAEHPIVTDLQSLDARALPFPLENLVHNLRSAIHNAALAIQFLVETVPNDTAVLQCDGRVIHNGVFHQRHHPFQRRDLLFQCGKQTRRRELFQLRFQRRQLLRCHGEGFQVTRCGFLEEHPCHQTLQIVHIIQQRTHLHEGHALLIERLHGIQTCHDLQRLHQRLFHPRFQQALSHGGAGIVQQPEHGAFALLAANGLSQFQIPPCVQIQSHSLGAVHHVNGNKTGNVPLLCLPNVVQHPAHGASPCAVLLDAQQLQRVHTELLADELPAGVQREARIIPQRHSALQTHLDEIHHRFQGERLRIQHQLRRRIAGEHVHDADGQVGSALRDSEGHLTGGEVSEAEGTAAVCPVVQAANVVVGVVVQHAAFNERAGGDDTDDIPFHQSLAQRRIGHLLADGDLIATVHQLFQVQVHAVVGHAAHGRTLVQTALLSCQRQFQLSGHQNGVLKKHLVEISQPEKQDAVAVFFLGCRILLHHGRQFFLWHIRQIHRVSLRSLCDTQ